MKCELCIIIFFLRVIYAKSAMKIVLLGENDQPEALGWFGDALRDFEVRLTNYEFSSNIIALDRNNENESFRKLCGLASQGISLLIDLTWSDWDEADTLTDQWSIPHAKTQGGYAILILPALLDVLRAKNATDVVFIFQTEKDLDQVLYNIVGKSLLRILVLSNLTEGQAVSLNNMRPIPSYFVIVGSTHFVQDTYKMAKKKDLVTMSDRWILGFTDLNWDRLDTSILEPFTTLLGLTKSIGCRLSDLEESCSLERDFKIQLPLISKTVDQIMKALLETMRTQQFNPILADCEAMNSSVENLNINNTARSIFQEHLLKNTELETSLFFWERDRKGITLRGSYELQVGDKIKLDSIAKWKMGEFHTSKMSVKLKPIKKFFRIGTTISIPWTYPKLDPETHKPLKTSKGQPIYEGYCIDFIEKMSKVMDFDYEIITPKKDGFGKKQPNGSWTGIIGDLVNGDTDMAVAATIMTSQREEVVDFVAPYFDQSGISIVIRKPVPKTSLFKFMTVLRIEVWLSILAALTLTAVLLSLLDRYSPYSARNNKNAYPYPCREFTLRESFWFALTSFTPQGGGEAPKALSGRVLVAAYWLFVVLMLATFTANLAAFLTVERMQTPVSSLEQLARQSRINYTVVEGQTTHAYFINMKHAEDTLYRVWKEITLNSSSDETIYQVWDYPIKEQYGHILLAINSSQPVATAEEGFRKVNEHEDSDFAFIHDSAQIKYEVSRNCNITQVGEVFGERPYAIAVQQGSRLQEDLSKIILELQKDRFFENLTAKYWNNSIRGVCFDDDESEGISLESLGGVFIATLFGLALAMITLAWEIFYYKRKDRKVKNKDNSPFKSKVDKLISQKRIKKAQKGFMKKNVTIGETFKPIGKLKPRVSYINVDPKIAWNP